MKCPRCGNPRFTKFGKAGKGSVLNVGKCPKSGCGKIVCYA